MKKDKAEKYKIFEFFLRYYGFVYNIEFSGDFKPNTKYSDLIGFTISIKNKEKNENSYIENKNLLSHLSKLSVNNISPLTIMFNDKNNSHIFIQEHSLISIKNIKNRIRSSKGIAKFKL